MTRRFGLHWIGAIIAVCFGSWIACNNGTGPSTVPAPPAAEPAALQEAAASSTTMARVAETAALTEDIPPWHDCLHDDGGSWQSDDARRCVAIQILNTVTGWRRTCGHNTAYFSVPDYQCCVDDGLGQCVPGSERPYSSPPEETPPQETEPEITEPEETEPEGETGPKVWIYGASPSKETELCEGDYIHVVGIRRSESVGELRGSMYLEDPEMEDRMLEYSPITGSFRLADGEDSITTYELDEKRIGRCPDCGEKRNVVLGIDDLIYTEDDSGDGESYRIGDSLVFQVRKATDVLCQPE